MADMVMSGASCTTYPYQVIHSCMQVHAPAVYVGRLGAGVLAPPHDHVGHHAYMDT